MESNLLDFNLLKSCFLVVGNPKAKKKLQRKLEQKPLTLCNTRMKQVQIKRYLGCQLSGSVGQSVSATVSKRIGVANKAIYEARSVVEDSRAMAVGGLSLGFQIWEQSVVPMLYFGSETWSEVPRKTMKALDKISLTQMRVTLGIGTGKGFIIPCLYFECGILLAKYRILLQQLLLNCLKSKLKVGC